MTGYRLHFKENRLPPSLNVYSRTHWAVKAKEKEFWINVISFYPMPEKPLKRYKLTLVRCSSVEPDWDGAVGSFKIVVDALRACKVIEDDKYSMSGPWAVSWKKVKQKEGHIIVTVEERKEI